MVRKWLTIIAFFGGAWVGYNYTLDLIGYYEFGVDEWSDQGATFLRAAATLVLGGLSALAVRFVINLVTRPE